MIVNMCNNKTNNVEFVSYTGKYPNLCRGVLTLKINNEIVKFGHDYCYFNYDTGKFNDNNYDKFWSSGGSITEDYHCDSAEWIINANKIPEKYKHYILEIDRIFNENVIWGCCGGCI